MRLIKFHEMNVSCLHFRASRSRLTLPAQIIRIAFRFVFTVPFIILGADGVRPHHHVNNSLSVHPFRNACGDG